MRLFSGSLCNFKNFKKLHLFSKEAPFFFQSIDFIWQLPKRRSIFRSSHPEVFLKKGVLKICSKFTGEHPCQSVISIKLQSNFIEITLRHGCSLVNLLPYFRTPFTKKTSGWLLLYIAPSFRKTLWQSLFIYSANVIQE